MFRWGPSEGSSHLVPTSLFQLVLYKAWPNNFPNPLPQAWRNRICNWKVRCGYSLFAFRCRTKKDNCDVGREYPHMTFHLQILLHQARGSYSTKLHMTRKGKVACMRHMEGNSTLRHEFLVQDIIFSKISSENHQTFLTVHLATELKTTI
jgi:hypothetical protein